MIEERVWGEEWKLFRSTYFYSQGALASALGCSRRTVQLVESGRTLKPRRNLQQRFRQLQRRHEKAAYAAAQSWLPEGRSRGGFASAIEDRYTEQARKDTDRVWAYQPDKRMLERNQAKWQYALEQRAGRLRAEAALLLVTGTLDRALKQGKPVVDSLVAALRDVQIMMFPKIAKMAQSAKVS
jgi:DNA-binding XRE family transcriptional regulator